MHLVPRCVNICHAEEQQHVSYTGRYQKTFNVLFWFFHFEKHTPVVDPLTHKVQVENVDNHEPSLMELAVEGWHSDEVGTVFLSGLKVASILNLNVEKLI